MHFKKVNFTGLLVDVITYYQMIQTFDQWLLKKSDRSHHVACVNVNCCAESLLDYKIKNVFNSADIVGPDGMPFVYWIRWILRQKCDRLYAPDIILEIGKIAVSKGYSFYLYGGAEGTAEKMKSFLSKNFPGINIVGTHSPPFRKLNDEEDAAICSEINSLKPDFIIVGLGSPKQDIWIQDHIEKIRGSIMIASGATFDFFSGRIKQAPAIIQKSGFEWLFRLFQDPKRLLKRYIYFNAVFVINFILQLLKIRKF